MGKEEITGNKEEGGRFQIGFAEIYQRIVSRMPEISNILKCIFLEKVDIEICVLTIQKPCSQSVSHVNIKLSVLVGLQDSS